MADTPKKSLLPLQQADQHALLAEQARLVARLGEITGLLSSGHLPTVPKAASSQAVSPSDFDRQAYAIGLIWRNPNISTRDLAQKIGVAKSTLFLPSFKDVADVLRARKSLSAGDFTDCSVDKDEDEDEE